MNGEVKKSDLGVRSASAVVMVAVAGIALWLGGWWWTIFVFTVALVCFVEFAALIQKATLNLTYRIVGILFAFLYIFIAAYGLLARRSAWTGNADVVGPIAVITVVGIVISTDVGAYFSGRTIGGPKIAAKISPNKTWAGLLGGMIAASVWTVLAVSFSLSHDNLDWFDDAAAKWGIYAATTGALFAIIAQIGDFFQSWLKRKADVKDSSKLIPGHGGVFDRIDGLLAVLFIATFTSPGSLI